jgi:hypothetical protein
MTELSEQIATHKVGGVNAQKRKNGGNKAIKKGGA